MVRGSNVVLLDLFLPDSRELEAFEALIISTPTHRHAFCAA